MRRERITHRRQWFITGQRRFISATTVMHHAITTIVPTRIIEAMGISMVTDMDIAGTAVGIEAIVNC